VPAVPGEPLLAGVRACVFDAYGTLFDVGSAAAACRDAALGEHAAALSALWREKQLQYTWLRGLQGRHADFWQVTGDALDFALETLGIADAALRTRLMNLYLTLSPYPEVAEVLGRLKRAGLGVAILSNGSPRMLEAAVAAAGIGGMVDAVLSVEEVGVYKPDPKVYQLAVERLALAPGAIAFQSANAWDAWAAAAFGMRVVWCNRQRQRPERLPGRPDCEITSLAELPALVGA
jgi:2-haloacid dehalogenase